MPIRGAAQAHHCLRGRGPHRVGSNERIVEYVDVELGRARPVEVGGLVFSRTRGPFTVRQVELLLDSLDISLHGAEHTSPVSLVSRLLAARAAAR